MGNERWLVEWVDGSHIKTFQRMSVNTYEMLHPQGNNVFDLQQATPKDYERYWEAWTRYTGYIGSDEIDLCLVCPNTISTSDFLSAAGSAEIRIASPTSWSVSDVLEYLAHTDRYGKAETQDESPARINLVDGQCLFVHSGDGGDFRPGDISEVTAPSPEKAGAKPAENDAKGSAISAGDQETIRDEGDSPQATIAEVREAIRRIAQSQCRTIDTKR